MRTHKIELHKDGEPGKSAACQHSPCKNASVLISSSKLVWPNTESQCSSRNNVPYKFKLQVQRRAAAQQAILKDSGSSSTKLSKRSPSWLTCYQRGQLTDGQLMNSAFSAPSLYGLTTLGIKWTLNVSVCP